MTLRSTLDWITHKRDTLARYGQRPATLWDIRLSMITSQLGLVALAALIFWAVL